MNTPNGLTAIKDIFAFPFRDPQWKNKFFIGSGITFAGTIIPVLPWLAVLGYGARIARRSAVAADTMPAGEAAPEGLAAASTLPEWDNWNELVMDGLRQLGVILLVSLPLLLLMVVGFGIYFVLLVGSVALQVDAPSADPGTVMIQTFGAVVVIYLTMALVMLFLPVTYLFMPAAAAHVAITRRFSDFFRAGDWLRVLRANLGGYFALLFFLAGLYVVYIVSLQFLYLTVVLCLVMPVVAAVVGFFIVVLFYHLSGLAYAGGTAALPAPAGLPSPAGLPAEAAPVDLGSPESTAASS